MELGCHTFSFGHYHQAPGASCSILVLSLVLFNAIPILLIYEFFIYLSPLMFLLLLAVTVIEFNNNLLRSLYR